MAGDETSLGKAVAYPERYDPSVLHPIARAEGRKSLGDLPLAGEDVWNAYELSWLDRRGKPQVACARFRFPADSPSLVESKSLKLYLNSLNQTDFASADEVRSIVQKDLSEASGADVAVEFYLSEHWGEFGRARAPVGTCLDGLAIDAHGYSPSAELLQVSEKESDEQLYSDLFRSRCPVTGQPDWASVEIDYRGRAVDHASLLAYLVSFRRHDAFHEQCVETLFADLYRTLKPTRLRVSAQFTRRGGLDINPVRALDFKPSEFRRLARQ